MTIKQVTLKDNLASSLLYPKTQASLLKDEHDQDIHLERYLADASAINLGRVSIGKSLEANNGKISAHYTIPLVFTAHEAPTAAFNSIRFCDEFGGYGNNNGYPLYYWKESSYYALTVKSDIPTNIIGNSPGYIVLEDGKQATKILPVRNKSLIQNEWIEVTESREVHGSTTYNVRKISGTTPVRSIRLIALCQL